MAAALLRLTLLVLAVAASAGCGGGNNQSATSTAETATTNTTTTAAQVVHTNADWPKVWSDPDAYRGETVKLVGRVFNVMRFEDGVALGVWMDPKNSALATAVGLKDPTFQVTENDYVQVTGKVDRKLEAEDESAAIPAVWADTMKVVDASAVVSPAYPTYGTLASTQGGVRVVVGKIEAAPDETRVYVTVSNRSADDVSFMAVGGELVANGRSIKERSLENALSELVSDLAPHSKTSGVIHFEEIPQDAALTLTLLGLSDDANVGIAGVLTWTFTWERPPTSRS